MAEQHRDHVEDTQQAQQQVSDRLRQVAAEKSGSWPEDDYVPHEKTRGSNPALEGAAVVGLLHGPAF